MKGYINSIETMGLVDGPGIRVVVFMQGCPLRCLYCHNPETWDLKGGEVFTPEQLFEKIMRYKEYFSENGGVTFSGGEPLLQADFLIEIMKLCKQNGINTCLDTSGFGTPLDREVLKYTDLVILDIKAANDESFKRLTGKSIHLLEKFIENCNELNKKIWIRQVIVPNINDQEEDMLELKEYIKKINNIEKIELLPYHTYGEVKYEELKIPYKLKKFPAMEEEKLQKLYNLLIS